jgi:3-oxoadipate enol-lactonase
MTAESGEILTDDGCRIAYSLARGGGRHRLALLHSLAMDRSFWSAVTGRLAAEADILLIDCRGHGRSDKPAGPYRVERFADDLASVFDHLAWPGAVVAGASMGGCVALAFAARHPARVDGLGLIDTTAWYGADAPAAWEARGRKAVENGLASLVDFQKTRWVSARFLEQEPEVVDHLVEIFLANDVPAYQETCRMLGQADLRPALAGFRFPVRIMVGEEDYATPPSMAEAMRDAIPGASLRIFEGARHLTPVEVPDLVAEELRALLPG